MARDSRDRACVLTPGGHPAIVLDREGHLLAAWGRERSPGLIVLSYAAMTHATVWMTRGTRYEGCGNARVHKYAADGRLMFSWGEPGDGPGRSCNPHDLCVDKCERIGNE